MSKCNGIRDGPGVYQLSIGMTLINLIHTRGNGTAHLKWISSHLRFSWTGMCGGFRLPGNRDRNNGLSHPGTSRHAINGDSAPNSRNKVGSARPTRIRQIQAERDHR